MTTFIETITRGWENFIARTSGPLNFRFFLQPAMAAFLATRAGIRDARAGRPPFLQELFSNASDRRQLLQSGWRDISRVFILAIALDFIYQMILQRRVYLLELFFTAVFLALIPYFLLRGPTSRLARLVVRKEDAARNPTHPRLTGPP